MNPVTEINWSRLARAIQYYTNIGYSYQEVPWIVSDGPYKETQPVGADSYTTFGGNLVASGEQSFMEIMVPGTLYSKQKMVCCTPCFRREPSPDELHLPYFMKVELIDRPGWYKGIYKMVTDAFRFFEKCGIPCEVVNTGKDTFDIVGLESRIELGSYGIRRWNNFTWVYGTGVAEPRASQVKKLEIFSAKQSAIQ